MSSLNDSLAKIVARITGQCLLSTACTSGVLAADGALGATIFGTSLAAGAAAGAIGGAIIFPIPLFIKSVLDERNRGAALRQGSCCHQFGIFAANTIAVAGSHGTGAAILGQRGAEAGMTIAGGVTGYAIIGGGLGLIAGVGTCVYVYVSRSRMNSNSQLEHIGPRYAVPAPVLKNVNNVHDFENAVKQHGVKMAAQPNPSNQPNEEELERKAPAATPSMS